MIYPDVILSTCGIVVFRFRKSVEVIRFAYYKTNASNIQHMYCGLQCKVILYGLASNWTSGART